MSEEAKEATSAKLAEATKSTDEEEANIEKAVQFWQHPSLRDVPTDQRRAYLHEKGVTDEQIHKAWDRIVERGDAAKKAPDVPAKETQVPSAAPHHPYPDRQAPHPSAANPYANHSAPMSYPSASYDQNNTYRQPYPQVNEEDGALPFAQGASLVAFGGFVGLAAAAAARWLNGGDFSLLPPPSLHAEQGRNMILPEEENPSVESGYEEEEEVEDYDDEDYEGEDEIAPEVQEKLLEQVQVLSETMKSHVGVQEKILQKLSTQGSSITNDSMSLLRSSGTQDSTNNSQSTELLLVWSQLVEIKSELKNLQGGNSSQEDQAETEKKISNTVSRLESCIETIEGSVRGKKSIPATSSTSPTPPMSPTTSSASPTPDPVPKDASPKPVEKESADTKPPQDEPEQQPKEPEQAERMTYTLRQSVRRLAEENEPTELRVGAQLMYLYIVNLTSKPDNARYRKIFTSNESFQKVEKLVGGIDLLLAVGFEEKEGFLEWNAGENNAGSPEVDTMAMERLQEAAEALGVLKSAKKSADLTEAALAVLSPDPDVQFKAPPRPPTTNEPQTTAASAVASTPTDTA